ncbi:MAG: hypothetical protein ACREC4_07640 [Methylocella sp.]
MRRMCCRRFAPACNPFPATRPRARAGTEIPDALKLLGCLDLKGKIVTGGAMFCQKSIVAKIVEKGGGCVLPVKDNQKNLRENIQTAFDEPGFPLSTFVDCPALTAPEKDTGASSSVRSKCCPRKPPASRKNGRLSRAFAASRAFGKARRTANGRTPGKRPAI